MSDVTESINTKQTTACTLHIGRNLQWHRVVWFSCYSMAFLFYFIQSVDYITHWAMIINRVFSYSTIFFSTWMVWASVTQAHWVKIASGPKLLVTI